MKGAGTDDDSLMRVVVSRAEIDMVQIKQAFLRDYGKTLASFISVSVVVAALIVPLYMNT